MIRVRREIGADDEQLPLQREDLLGHRRVVRERPRQPQHGHRLVGGAVGLGHEVVLRHATP